MLCRDRIPVILLVEFAVGRSSLNVSVNSCHVECTITDVSTLIYLRILGEVELVELMPAYKIPVTVPVVEHQFATTYTTYLPNEVAYASVVLWVSLRIYGEVRHIYAVLQQVDTLVEIVLSKCA